MCSDNCQNVCFYECLPTCWRWVHRVDFCFCTQKTQIKRRVIRIFNLNLSVLLQCYCSLLSFLHVSGVSSGARLQKTPCCLFYGRRNYFSDSGEWKTCFHLAHESSLILSPEGSIRVKKYTPATSPAAAMMPAQKPAWTSATLKEFLTSPVQYLDREKLLQPVISKTFPVEAKLKQKGHQERCWS